MTGPARRPFIGGNWKMHGDVAMAHALTDAICSGLGGLDVEVAVFPPYPYLGMVAKAIDSSGSHLGLGAQDLSIHASGAHTGEVSGSMLKDMGCQYVLVGHSERRADHAESSQLVALKCVAAQASGLTPIICVGETLAEREAGKTEAVVLGQLDAVINQAGIEAFAHAIIAYEPVWAIGTGMTATPEQAQAVHASIRARISSNSDTIGGQVRVIYGGSVKPDNAPEILSCEDIDGGLIGGASLSAESFLGICGAAR